MSRIEKTKKKATKKNENWPPFYIAQDKTKQLIEDMLNNQKQHKSQKKVHTKKNETEKNKTNKYLPCSEIDLLLESSSQSKSNDKHDSPNTQNSHNLNVKKKKMKNSKQSSRKSQNQSTTFPTH